MTYRRMQDPSGIHPDGFTGALLAGESVLDGAVILHGPTGCRAHHSVMSEHTFPRDDVPERLNFLEPFYFGQPRIPTTYLDGDDFVFGAREKLVTAIREIVKRNPSLLTIVNSPGAALIGDNITQAVAESGVPIPCAVIEMPALSCSLAEGYQQGLVSALQALSLPPLTPEARTVALVGLSIAHQHWAGSVAELRRLLGLCGIEVLCAVGAGSSVEEYRRLLRAACYAVVHDEYADLVGPWLTEHYGGIVAASDAGAPLGFDATARWVEAVARAVDADPAPALEDIFAERRRVSRLLGQATGSSAVLKGMTFAIQADPSIAMPLARWLYEYIGMLPVAVETPDSRETPLTARLRAWLSDIGCAEAWQAPWHLTDPDLLFAGGQQVALAKATDRVGGIEVMLPARACLDIVPKATLGASGAAWLVEQVLRELWWVLWV
ncbi:MAG: Light-independent protochlorophyllide reductase subunit B [Syntrophorhabdaceae bacterium PtaU1.Bin034]|nr:MAG: Light-independent protochlorophyllide reductase subunit B [Syntrophorhabdaceae bacterium PtaU1.Bin034]